MQETRPGALVFLSLGLCGCAIRPVPEDVATSNMKHIDTVSIVRQIRCEIRDSLKAFALGSMKRRDPGYAKKIADSPRGFIGMRVSDFPLGIRDGIEKYDQGAIVYEFTFDMTVSNTTGIDTTLSNKHALRTFGVGVKAKNDLSRQNIRAFQYSDVFWNLLTEDDEGFCSRPVTSNHQYPISGRLNLDEVVGTFLNLNEFGKLGGTEKAPNLPTLVDKMLFTTTVSGSLSPALTIAPAAGFTLGGPGFELSGKRVDIHKLTLALSLPDDTAKPSAKANSAIKRAQDAIKTQRENQVKDVLSNTPILLVPDL